MPLDIVSLRHLQMQRQRDHIQGLASLSFSTLDTDRRREVFRSRKYKYPLSLLHKILTFVPQSKTTGSVLAGLMPAHRVYNTSFATDIRIPPTP
jgi:hypothetical protein